MDLRRIYDIDMDLLGRDLNGPRRNAGRYRRSFPDGLTYSSLLRNGLLRCDFGYQNRYTAAKIEGHLAAVLIFRILFLRRCRDFRGILHSRFCCRSFLRFAHRRCGNRLFRDIQGCFRHFGSCLLRNRCGSFGNCRFLRRCGRFLFRNIRCGFIRRRLFRRFCRRLLRRGFLRNIHYEGGGGPFLCFRLSGCFLRFLRSFAAVCGRFILCGRFLLCCRLRADLTQSVRADICLEVGILILIALRGKLVAAAEHIRRIGGITLVLFLRDLDAVQRLGDVLLVIALCLTDQRILIGLRCLFPDCGRLGLLLRKGARVQNVALCLTQVGIALLQAERLPAVGAVSV